MASQKQIPKRNNRDDQNNSESFEEEEDYEVSELESSLDADAPVPPTTAKSSTKTSTKPKEKSFKERYAEEVEIADQKALAFRQRDEAAIMRLKLKYLEEKNVMITEKMK